jgi:hypothetical protein
MQKWAKRAKILAPWPLYIIGSVVQCRSLTSAGVGDQGGKRVRTEFWRDACCKMFIWREENIKLDVSEIVRVWEMDGSTFSGQFPRNSLVLNVHETLV